MSILDINLKNQNLKLHFDLWSNLTGTMIKYISKVEMQDRICKECGNFFEINALARSTSQFCSMNCRAKYAQRNKKKKIEDRNKKYVKNNDLKEYINYWAFFVSLNTSKVPRDILEEEFYNYSMNLMGRVNELGLKDNTRRNYLLKSLRLTYKRIAKNYFEIQEHEIGFDDLQPSVRAKYIEEINYE